MKKILLITYYFPPCGGAPVQRWLRFIPKLIEDGYGVTVICPEQGDYPSIDHSLMDSIPQEVKIIRCGKQSLNRLWKLVFRGGKAIPYGNLEQQSNDGLLKRFMIWLRLNLIIPDMRMFWNPAALKAATDELRRDTYCTVITTGPPQSTHLVGLTLKQRFNIHWITDFRDPWSEIHYLKLNPPGKLSLRFHKYLEKKVISSADTNIIVSDSISRQLPQGSKTVIYNGFEQKQFETIQYSSTDVFRIKYIGMLTAGQKIEPLVTALQRLGDERLTELSIIGTNDRQYLDELCKRSAALQLRYVDFIPHNEALREMVNAELLVLLINEYPGNEGMLTTKLFEYLGSRTPILCLGNTMGEAADVIRQCDAGKCYEYHDKEVLSYLQMLYQKWNEGKPLRSTGDISAYETSSQVGKLLDLLP